MAQPKKPVITNPEINKYVFNKNEKPDYKKNGFIIEHTPSDNSYRLQYMNANGLVTTHPIEVDVTGKTLKIKDFPVKVYSRPLSEPLVVTLEKNETFPQAFKRAFEARKYPNVETPTPIENTTLKSGAKETTTSSRPSSPTPKPSGLFDIHSPHHPDYRGAAGKTGGFFKGMTEKKERKDKPSSTEHP